MGQLGSPHTAVINVLYLVTFAIWCLLLRDLKLKTHTTHIVGNIL
jgi:hypothetical protein